MKRKINEERMMADMAERRESPESDAIWTCGTHRVDGTAITYIDAVEMFSRQYWAEPRDAVMEDDGETFTMRGGGGRKYRIECFPLSFGRIYGVFVIHHA